jgi:hypothetical protein
VDELTRERYPHGVPYAERYALPVRPIPLPPVRARMNRLILCGTADLGVLEAGGPNNTALARDRRLTEAIRTYQGAPDAA